jgi:hypothetical protein
VRIRQFVIVARDLEKTVGDLTAVLGIEVAFNDPSARDRGGAIGDGQVTIAGCGLA